MKHKTNKSDILIAGAWYRILKTFIAVGSIAIVGSLDLTKSESAKVFSIINKIEELETSIGLERLASQYFQDKNVSNIFYGGIGVKARGDIDKQVKQNICEILSDWLKIAREGDTFDIDTKERIRIIDASN